mgnify:CR=1 FL=1
MPEANFFKTSDIKVYVHDESAFGTPITTTSSWFELPTTSFSLPEISAPVEVATARSGALTTELSQASHNLHTKVYTFDITLKGSAVACEKAMELLCESASSPYKLDGDYSFPDTYKDGESVGTQKTFLFKGVGSGATNNDLQLTSVVATGVTISEAVDSENGELTIVVNCMTAYQPAYVNQAVGTPTKISGVAKNIKLLTTYNLNNGSPRDLHIMNWEISLTRSVERVATKDYTNYKPYGYVMVGQWEVAGSISCKKDTSIENLLSELKSGTFGLNLGEASNFTISVPKCKVNESTMDAGGSIMMQTIPFTAYCENPDASNGDENIFSLTIA